jgi:hypothetical protein
MWINEFLVEEHGDAAALVIIADIDHRYELSPFTQPWQLM